MPRPRSKPVRVLQSPLTGRIYALTDYSISADGKNFVAVSKHDVTEDIRALISQAIEAEPRLACICSEDVDNAVGCICGATQRQSFLAQHAR
jgi:hypothetical protein